MPTLSSSLFEGDVDTSKSEVELVLDQLCLQAQDAIAELLKRTIPPSINLRAPGMVAAIHFHYDAVAGSAEINDEAPAQDDLPPELHAEDAAASNVTP